MIFSKLDWFSAVFEGYSIGNVLDKLGLLDEFMASAMIHTFETDSSFGTTLMMNIEGVNVQLQKVEFEFRMKELETGEYSDAYKIPFDYINLSISGKGLDFLRHRGFTPELHLRKPEFWLRGVHERVDQRQFHVTRCDFAYDFINEQPDFMNNFLSYLEMSERRGWLDANSRLKNGFAGGLCWSVKRGSSEKTIYLGSTRSDKLLRIYDKVLEQCPNGIWKQDPPSCYGKIESWIRFELQTRRDFAERCLYASSSLLEEIKNRDILDWINQYKPTGSDLDDWDSDTFNMMICCLGFIGEKFSIREEDGVRLLPFFADLLDWKRLPGVRSFHILRQKDKIQDSFTRSQNFIFGSGSSSLLSLLLIMGKDQFLQRCQTMLDKLSNPSDTLTQARRKALLSRIYGYCLDHDLTVEDLPCSVDGGRFIIG